MCVSHQPALIEASIESKSFHGRHTPVVLAVLAIVLLLLPSIIVHSVQRVVVLLCPVFLFAFVEIPRFQWPPLRPEGPSLELSSHAVSLFNRPPPQFR